MLRELSFEELTGEGTLDAVSAHTVSYVTQIFVTDPPYADAVHYHEITEYFIA